MTNSVISLLIFGLCLACSKNDEDKTEIYQKTWPEALSGIQLSHIESGSSLNADYTKSTQVYLCANGSFYMSIIDSITGAEFDGLWQVADKTTNQTAILTLQFSDGDLSNYQLSLSQNGIMVDGSLFKYTYNQSQCN